MRWNGVAVGCSGGLGWTELIVGSDTAETLRVWIKGQGNKVGVSVGV